jgi:hypothetical protein
MPRMDQAPNNNRLIKLLLLGDGKIGKTTYAGLAAEKGFNVLYIDGDVGAQSLGTLPKKAQERIYLLPVGDTILGGARDSNFIELMQEFTTNIRFLWNDSLGRIARLADKKDGTSELWEITPSKMDSNCVLVLDSWTGLVESIMMKAARANGVDISDATTSEMRPVYQSGALMATAMLQVIRALPCHCIVIGHPDEYQHKVAPEGKKVKDISEKDYVVDWTRMVPKSTSRPHGLTMAKYFTDVAWMEASRMGERMLNFKLRHTHVSGGHFDDSKPMAEYSFDALVKRIGGTIPTDASIDGWLKILPPGEATPVETKVLDGTAAAAPIKGVSAMFAKKPAPQG